MRKIFIPIFRYGNHWACVCIDTSNYTIYFYDSLYNDEKAENVIFERIETYFQQVFRNQCGLDIDFWNRTNMSGKIMQENGKYNMYCTT